LYRSFNSKLNYGVQLSYTAYDQHSNFFYSLVYKHIKQYSAQIGVKYYFFKKNKVANIYTKLLIGATLNKMSLSNYNFNEIDLYKIGFSGGIYFELINHLDVGISLQGLNLNGLLILGVKF